ncbi:MetQ/NlpA family ABC transporter substrate-binding protein [Mycobacterium antarcticum]|uniref:MetQ/NlpA family ABC transporter substrate-binding protein n=1 Tax=Mycolicibacterium sp. TUM20984 TaxID=3023368 RepID=UPI00238B1858|nr:MetQ/NlpA family ABC transporter substrate-binding protein [Mycolicibacterium sp. TUM20984]GLP81707.1 metal ABC transporter substrate-binding protein [Mycolicibacterium sp. TUM20984]
MTTTPTKVDESDDHGFELRRRSKWIWPAVGLIVVVVAVVSARFLFFGDTKSPNEIPGATLVVATNEGNAAEQALIEFIATDVAPRHGIKVAFRGLADSNTINRAVSDGEVAGTIYQHELWLGQVLEANPDFRETAATPVFRWGFGIWSDKYTDPSQLPNGANVSLYSDPANEAQGLWLLERAGLIMLNPAVDKFQATQKDIVANPRNLKFTLLDFAAQSRSLPDLDAAVGYTEYYLAAKIPISHQIFAPPAPDEFAGQLTIGSKWAETDNVKKLVETFKDPAVQQYLATDPSVKNILLPL